MPLNYYLARLTVDDLSALCKLEEETKLAFWGFDNYRHLLEEFPEYFGFKAVVMTCGGNCELAGFFLARALLERLEILKVGVNPHYQRQGLGTVLMEAAYAEGIRRGCNRCSLEVRKSNDAAVRFYQGHAFRIAGTRLRYYTDPEEDAWVMEKSL
jgi:[ribosomal protein S18]-alanine N-acetyltransferase